MTPRSPKHRLTAWMARDWDGRLEALEDHLDRRAPGPPATHHTIREDGMTEQGRRNPNTGGSTVPGGPAADPVTAPGLPAVVDRATFQAALDEVRVREKAHTREGDAIAAGRRRLPMVEVDAGTPAWGRAFAWLVVVGYAGLAGYAGGLDRKLWLLEHEHVDTSRLYTPVSSCHSHTELPRSSNATRPERFSPLPAVRSSSLGSLMRTPFLRFRRLLILVRVSFRGSEAPLICTTHEQPGSCP